MCKQLGLWIDHKKAIIVTEMEKGEDIECIASEIGKHVKYRGASHPKSPYSAQYQQGDDQLDNKFNEQLKKFYGRVIERIRTADSVLILGPGEAKSEFEKRLIHEKIKAHVVGVETADKMTEQQIAARVRDYFKS